MFSNPFQGFTFLNADAVFGGVLIWFTVFAIAGYFILKIFFGIF